MARVPRNGKTLEVLEPRLRTDRHRFREHLGFFERPPSLVTLTTARMILKKKKLHRFMSSHSHAFEKMFDS